MNNYGDFVFSNIKKISLSFYKQMKRGKVKPNDILIVKDGATTGKTSFVTDHFPHFPCAINEHVFRLSVKYSIADPRYIFYYLYSPKGNLEILDDFRGATIGGISQEFIEKVYIPLPPLPEQRRIAARLAQADRLRRLRRTARQLGQTYLQSVFVEMFGDVAANSKKLELAALGFVCKVIYRYPTFYGFSYVEKGVPVARIGNILGEGTLDPNLSSYVCIPQRISIRFPRTILELNDIVMAVRGDGSTGKRIGFVNSTNLVGANISPNLLRFKADSKTINPLYLFHLLVSDGGQILIERHITRTAKKTITASNIKGIMIPLPKMTEQDRFAAIVQRYECLRTQQREAERQAEMLFQSLLNQAFTGEA